MDMTEIARGMRLELARTLDATFLPSTSFAAGPIATLGTGSGNLPARRIASRRHLKR